jgi:hypothetical protein
VQPEVASTLLFSYEIATEGLSVVKRYASNAVAVSSKCQGVVTV